MSETVLVAMIGGLALVLAPGGIGAVLLNRKLNVIRDQVANDHDVNLRDDLDTKHTENGDLLHQLVRDVGGIKKDLRTIRKKQYRHDNRLHALETKD